MYRMYVSMMVEKSQKSQRNIIDYSKMSKLGNANLNQSQDQIQVPLRQEVRMKSKHNIQKDMEKKVFQSIEVQDTIKIQQQSQLQKQSHQRDSQAHQQILHHKTNEYKQSQQHFISKKPTHEEKLQLQDNKNQRADNNQRSLLRQIDQKNVNKDLNKIDHYQDRFDQNLIQMIDSAKRFQQKSQNKMIKQIVQKQLQGYMTAKEKQLYDLYDQQMNAQLNQLSLNTHNQSQQNHQYNKSQQPILPKLQQTNIYDLQVLKNNILRYNSKFRTGHQYQDDNSTPLHKLHVCKCGATFIAHNMLTLHIDKKHSGDPSYIVKFVDTNPNSQATVKIQQNIGLSTTATKQKNLEEYQRFQCRCGRVMSSYRALKIHITWQHSDDPSYADESQALLPHIHQHYIEMYKNGIPSKNGIFYCGCGKYYTCSSALNYHIRNKHDKQAPPGTIGGYGGYRKVISNKFVAHLDEKVRSQIPQQPKRPKRSHLQWYHQDEEDQPLKDEDHSQKDEIKPQKATLSFNNMKVRQFYCGCGNFYSVASSLYLHIRQKHKGIPPQGTKGGPGIQLMTQKALNRHQAEIEYFKTEEKAKCSLCNAVNFANCYFECLVCPRHLLCENCFFRRDEIQGYHDWKVKEINQVLSRKRQNRNIKSLQHFNRDYDQKHFK